MSVLTGPSSGSLVHSVMLLKLLHFLHDIIVRVVMSGQSLLLQDIHFYILQNVTKY